MSEEDGLIKVT